MTRVYSNQSETSDSLRFLDTAEIELGPMVTLRKGEIIRYIEANAPKTEAAKA
jgi:hypothetical protein